MSVPVTLEELLSMLERIAPPSYAESWDNVGLLAGDPSQPVRRTLLTIDLTEDVLEEALKTGCELVIAYHPPIFEGLKRITAESLIYRALRAGLALYSPHTALDVAEGGTNDLLARVLGLTMSRPLQAPRQTLLDYQRTRPTLPLPIGLGRMGSIAPCSRAELLQRIKQGLGIPHLLVAGPLEGEITRVACCAGACGNLLNDAIQAGIELYLTGELRHHDALKAAQRGVTVVCTLHSNSERAYLPVLKARLEGSTRDLEVLISQQDRDPFFIS